jgi:hypothetical protein
LYHFLADAVLATHLAFIVFVLVGGVVAIWRPRIAWFHLPVAAWGAFIEIIDWPCPLTTLENYFLKLAGDNSAYQGDFILHYLSPIIYPAGLTIKIQYVLGGFVIVLNGILYAVVVVKARQRRRNAAVK